MTRQDTTKLFGLPAFIIGVATVLFFLLQSAFVPRREYERDKERIEQKLDCALFNLPTNCKQTMSPRGP